MKKRCAMILLIMVPGIIYLMNSINCDKKRSSTGSEDKILVLADTTDWAALEDSLRAVFEIVRPTPQSETLFTLKRVNPADLGKLQRWKNLLLAGTLQSTGTVKSLIEGFLNPDNIARVQQDSAFIFGKNEPWAQDQFLMVLVARDNETFIQQLSKHKKQLFDMFDDHVNKFVKKQMFLKYEQKDINSHLQKTYGWHVRVQHDYFIAAENDTDNVVWLRRLGLSNDEQQRWLLVHWIATNDPSQLEESAEWVVNLRNRLTKKYYAGDIVEEKFNSTAIVNFNGRRAFRLDGLWTNVEKIVGGPFRSYVFYQESDKRIYFIDLAVFAPGSKKLPFLRQLDIMAHTFMTAD